jgi:hypothetical protein
MAPRIVSAARQFQAIVSRFGAVAQLGERSVRNAEVRGSIPLGSTAKAINHRGLWLLFFVNFCPFCFVNFFVNFWLPKTSAVV